jgi:hypothetical protein
MMAAGGLDGLELATENPLLNGWVTDANEVGGFAWRQHVVLSGHGIDVLALSRDECTRFDGLARDGA